MQRDRVVGLLLVVLWVLVLTSCQPMAGNEPPPLNLSEPSATSQPTVVAALPSDTPYPTVTPGRETATASAERRPEAVDATAPTPDVTAATPQVRDERWTQRAELGTYAPAEEDTGQIDARALAEGYVVLYGDTSRAERSLGTLMETYAGLEAEAYTLGSQDVYLQLLEGFQEGQLMADVYLVADAPRTLGLLKEGKLWNYVPGSLREQLPPDAQEPLLTHHWTAVTLVYNTNGGKPDVDSWWDLTRPEWQGKVALPNPIIDERMLYLFATMVERGDAFAEAYLQEFGQEIVLDEDCPNAAYQWLKAFYQNGPRWMVGDAEVVSMVTNPEGDTGLLGVAGSEQLARASLDELPLGQLVEVAPVAGLRWRTYLAIVNYAEHPYAAKLAVRWLMGDGAGGQGYAAWYEPGFYPARADVPDVRGSVSRAELESRLWEPNPAYIAEHLQDLRDFLSVR